MGEEEKPGEKGGHRKLPSGREEAAGEPEGIQEDRNVGSREGRPILRERGSWEERSRLLGTTGGMKNILLG